MAKQILVTRSSMPPFEEYLREIEPLWESHWLTNMGEKHKRLEEDLKSYLDVANIALFVNGHTALECVLEAMNLGADGRRKVITTPFTFASTTHAIVRVGLEPVLADIDPESYTLDPAQVEALIDDETCAIVPVHVYGNLCDVDAFADIARRHDLKLVYDAAHAFGVTRKGVSSAAFGDASMFSFHATKVFNTIEGGAVCFGDPALGPLLDQWKNFGITSQEDVEYVGGNAKMNEFQAAMGLCNLRYIDENIAERKHIAGLYEELLGEMRGITIWKESSQTDHNYAYYPIVVDPDAFGCTRDHIYDVLMEKGIYTRKYFWPLTNGFNVYAGRTGYDVENTPVAARISSRVLALPIYPGLGDDVIESICGHIKDLYEGRS